MDRRMIEPIKTGANKANNINRDNRKATMYFIKYYLFLTLIIVSVFPVKAQLRDILTFEVQSLREESDSLIVDYRLWIPRQLVEPGQGLRISPVVQVGDSMLSLPPVTILGSNKQKVMDRYHRNSGLGSPPASLPPNDSLIPYSYTIRVPYRLWMDSARFSIRQEVSGYRGKKVITRYLLSDKIELEAKEAYQPKIQVAIIVPEKEEKRRRLQGKAFLDFQVGRSVILPNFRRNPEELQKIDDAVLDVKNNQDVQITGLYIEGYASPDGKYETNGRLSRQRAMALKKYIKEKFSLDGNLFRISSVAEDWDGLSELVRASGMPQKDRILEIISTIGIFDGREAALMKLDRGIAYRQMLKDMFPELRRVEYRIDYTVRDYDPEEVRSISRSRPEDLSELEFYRLALASEKEEKGAGKDKAYSRILLEVIPKYFPDSPAALNNAAAILLENGELSTAKRYLDKAGDSPEAWNNQGVLFLLAGELDKAEELFLKAREGGVVQASHNLMETRTKREDNKKMERYTSRK